MAPSSGVESSRLCSTDVLLLLSFPLDWLMCKGLRVVFSQAGFSGKLALDMGFAVRSALTSWGNVGLGVQSASPSNKVVG